MIVPLNKELSIKFREIGINYEIALEIKRVELNKLMEENY
jgi:hypothetical protein